VYAMLRYILLPFILVALFWNCALSVRVRRHGENTSEEQVKPTTSSDEQEVPTTGSSIVEIRMPGVRTKKVAVALVYLF
jgi:hypothetical protein